jgi:hypothetical protein
MGGCEGGTVFDSFAVVSRGRQTTRLRMQAIKRDKVMDEKGKEELCSCD